jgi:hypothetical protein
MAGFVEINFRPDNRTLKQFGFIAVVGFGLLALAAFREKAIFAFGLGGARLPVAAALAALGVLSGLASLVYPRANWPIFVGISVLSFPIGFVVSFVIMGLLFFVIFGVVAVCLRVMGRDPMNRSYDAKAPSYWITPDSNRNQDSYFRQF